MQTTDWIPVTALALSILLMFRVMTLSRKVKDLQSQLERIDSRSGMGGSMFKTNMETPTPLYVQNMEFAPDLERRLHLLLAEGKKIQAIKVLREARNLSLKDAKDYIDHMDQGR